MSSLEFLPTKPITVRLEYGSSCPCMHFFLDPMHHGLLGGEYGKLFTFEIRLSHLNHFIISIHCVLVGSKYSELFILWIDLPFILILPTVFLMLLLLIFVLCGLLGGECCELFTIESDVHVVFILWIHVFSLLFCWFPCTMYFRRWVQWIVYFLNWTVQFPLGCALLFSSVFSCTVDY